VENIKAFLRILGQINYILTSKQKRESIIVFVSMIVCSCLELLGISAIYPLIQAIMDENAIRTKWFIKWVFVLSPDISYNSVIVILCICIAVLYLVKNVASLACSYIQSRFSAKFQREVSTTMLRYVMKRPYEYFVNTNNAETTYIVTGSSSATYGVLTYLFRLVAEGLTFIMIGVFLLYTDWMVAVAAMVLSISCLLLTIMLFKKRLKQAGKDEYSALIEQGKALGHAVGGIKQIIIMDRRELFVDHYVDTALISERIARMKGFLESCPDRLIEGVCIGGFVLIVCIRIVLGANPIEFIPVLGTFAMGAFKMLPSMSKMSSNINGIVFQQARLSMCVENIKEIRKIEEERKKIVIDSDIKENNDGNLFFQNSISVKNVTWKYSKSVGNVLQGLSITIHKGESIALIGSSGAGKTTLADVILGLFPPQEGGVFMDDIDIRTIPHTWCRMVGYVSQVPFLLDDTIRANVAFGLPESQVDDKKIWQALEEAQIDEYVKSLPEGLNSYMGANGIRLSGGQRQRLTIARALYESPPILIFDEATSALDTETESEVMESIESLLGRKTLIIIAHRLTTIRNCDRVFEIVDGKAIERDKNSVIPAALLG